MPAEARSTARACAVLAAVALAIPAAMAQVSPGPLSRAHADLDGATRCLECHGGGDDTLSANCLACHGEIAWHVERRTGLHGRLERDDCSGCHPEHAGRDFELIDWGRGGPDAFDHARAGWPLDGRHATVACRDCHRAEFRVSPVAGRIERDDPGRTWSGLSPGCAACHRDPHASQLGAGCETCHGTTAWKPARAFDHAATGYPLTGKHADVKCERCHKPPAAGAGVAAPASEAARFAPLAHEKCSDCHADPHAGRLGPACASCHATDGFRVVNRKSFDHSRTGYPLLGRHASVACERCHDPNRDETRRPRSDRCDACHPDPHAGRATLAGRAADCGACHDVRSFDRSTYTAERHASSAYPLEGRHASVPCGKCHVRDASARAAATLGAARVRMRPAHAECRACHADGHPGQLMDRADREACDSCHRVAGWKPSTFDPGRHAQTRLPLEDRHAQAACGSCHAPLAPDRAASVPARGPRLSGIDPGCGGCHIDPHRERLTAAGACADCHDAGRFRPARTDAESHAGFGYALAGAHRTVPCIACHDELGAPPMRVTLLGRGVEVPSMTFERSHERCRDCHADPHGGQFAARADGGACSACHDVRAFRPAPGFAHDRDAAFALAGAHVGVACERCHPMRADAGGTAVRVYRPIAHACEDCHGKNNLGSNDRLPGGRPGRGSGPGKEKT